MAEHSHSSLERVCWVWIDWQRPNVKITQMLLILQLVVSHKHVSIAEATKLPYLPVSSINNIQWMCDASSDVIIRISQLRSEGDLVDLVRVVVATTMDVAVVVVTVTTMDVDVVGMATITIVVTITIPTNDGIIAAADLETPLHQVVVPRTNGKTNQGVVDVTKDGTIGVVVVGVAVEVQIDRVVVMIRMIRTGVHAITVSSHRADVTTTATATTVTTAIIITIPTVMDEVDNDEEVPRPALPIEVHHK
jgi:hypothetical protein